MYVWKIREDASRSDSPIELDNFKEESVQFGWYAVHTSIEDIKVITIS